MEPATPPTPKARGRLPQLTDRQIHILCFIRERRSMDGLYRSPALRKIAADLGIAKSTAWEHVEALKAKRCLTGDPGVNGSLELTDTGERACSVWLARATPRPRDDS